MELLLSYYKTLRTNEFTIWLNKQTENDQNIIDTRLYKIEEYGHFGDCKSIGNGLLELRWKNGRRIYFARSSNLTIVFINGGFKNAQKKDIKKANKIYRRYSDN